MENSYLPFLLSILTKFHLSRDRCGKEVTGCDGEMSAQLHVCRTQCNVDTDAATPKKNERNMNAVEMRSTKSVGYAESVNQLDRNRE